jgi:eukaryotic-like serine/threonine-protein kinase
VDSTTSSKELYEFDVFRVDPEREMLLRSGDPVQLPPKAFQVLLVLIRNSQEVVTKDDLMKQVWPDTFVEEANLSRNIFLLRKALGESPQDHRYVLTVPGRGYRLAERVRLVPDREASIVAATHSKIQLQVKETRGSWWFAFAAIILVGVATATAWLYAGRKPRLTEKETLVLSDFTNSTGDPVFDETLRRGLAVQLAQSPYLAVISDERMQRILKLMGQPANAPVSREASRAICERTASAAVLEGSISSLGTVYVLGLRATSCSTGDVLAEAQVQAARKEEVLPVLGQLTSTIRQQLGESLSSVSRFNTPLPEATTPSLDALRAYSLGSKSVFGAAGPAESIPFFKRAIELDPQFATAYAMLGRVYADLGDASASSDYVTRAYQMKDRTSEVERYFIIMNYEMQVSGNLEKARDAGELWENAYPRDAHPRGLMSFLYQSLGRMDQAIVQGQTAVALDPDLVPGYINLAWAYLLADQQQRAEEVIQKASSRGIELPDLYILLYDIAFLKNDEVGMARAVEMAKGKPGAEHWMAAREACVLAYRGNLKEARTLTRKAALLATRDNQPDRAGLYLAGLAAREALFGNAEDAKDAANSAMSLSKDRDVLYGAAFAYAWIKEEGRATAITDELRKRFPEDTFVNGIYLPTLHAVLSRNHGDLARVNESIDATARFEFSVPGTWFGFFGMMYSTYVRGMAYMDAGQPDRAAVEFEKIVSHRGFVASDALGAVANIELARALKRNGAPRRQ